MGDTKKSTRATKPKEEPKESPKSTKAPATFKVFYIAKSLLLDNSETQEFRLERFYHPGRSSQALFITHAEKTLLEVIEFSEPRRSWLINNDVCSNGSIYMSTPVDVTFLALHQIRKHCTSKALELETIHDEQDPSVKRLMTTFVSNASLTCIADVKSVGDMTFYKYNGKKALAWLAIKAKRLAGSLQSEGIHCGRSALSQNYMRSEKAAEEPVQYIDFLRMACDIIGGYLDVDLHEELTRKLKIPVEIKTSNEEKDKSGKRKSQNSLKANDNKKMKITANSESAADKLKSSSLLDESQDEERVEAAAITNTTSPVPAPPRATPLKERVLTTKEKKLAIGAKGSKSIASFFAKK